MFVPSLCVILHELERIASEERCTYNDAPPYDACRSCKAFNAVSKARKILYDAWRELQGLGQMKYQISLELDDDDICAIEDSFFCHLTDEQAKIIWNRLCRIWKDICSQADMQEEKEAKA